MRTQQLQLQLVDDLRIPIDGGCDRADAAAESRGHRPKKLTLPPICTNGFITAVTTITTTPPITTTTIMHPLGITHTTVIINL
jgi:hypothetical protein